VLGFRTEAAPENVTARLGIPAGTQVHVFERLRYADAAPLALMRNHVPAALLSVSAADLEAACPAPVTGARTRWHGTRSPADKTSCRRRLQSGDHLTWTAAAFSAITHFTQSCHAKRRSTAARDTIIPGRRGPGVPAAQQWYE